MYHQYGEGFYAYDDEETERYEAPQEGRSNKVFQDEDDKQKYVLMLAGYYRPKRRTTEREEYEAMLLSSST